MARKCKSVGVTNKVLYPYDNVMVIERSYKYVDGFDAERASVRLPKETKKGWVPAGVVKDDYIKIDKVGYWTVRELYIKEGHVYKLPK